MNSKLDNQTTYTKWVRLHRIRSFFLGQPNRGVENAIGGNFDSLGKVMAALLVHHGLKSDQFLVDVGCGSGRLTKAISGHLESGQYLGIDIISVLLDSAKKQTNNPSFNFKQASGYQIPLADEKADMVCFFSVFTHILHEHTYAYLQEAARVLKPGGKIVFSFLEFGIKEHWNVFESNLKNLKKKNSHLNMFMSRDGIECWADKLDLTVEGIWDGDKPHIPISEPIVTDEGTQMTGMGWLGQSVCVLKK